MGTTQRFARDSAARNTLERERCHSSSARRAASRSRDNIARRPDPEQVFRLRCWARARLYFAGELALIEAVDELQGAAVVTGLVARLGQDRVQTILAGAFDEVTGAR